MLVWRRDAWSSNQSSQPDTKRFPALVPLAAAAACSEVDGSVEGPLPVSRPDDGSPKTSTPGWNRNVVKAASYRHHPTDGGDQMRLRQACSPPSRVRLTVALVSLGLVSSGCTSLWPMQTDDCAVLSEVSPEVLTESAYPEVPEGEANTGVVVTNTGPPTRVTVRLDDKVALDVKLPGSNDCSHAPIYSFHYDLPARRFDVSAESDDGKRNTESVLIGERTMWVTVMTQESFPIHLMVTREKPAFD